MIKPKTESFGWPTIECDIPGLVALTEYWMKRGVKYVFGAKDNPLHEDASAVTALDCSGFDKDALWHKAYRLLLPDGSVAQHDWAKQHGFKKTTVGCAKLKDGYLRIAFLPPKNGEPGHVALILNGLTLESHSSKGVDRRPWTGTGWQAECEVFVLAEPDGGKG